MMLLDLQSMNKLDAWMLTRLSGHYKTPQVNALKYQCLHQKKYPLAPLIKYNKDAT